MGGIKRIQRIDFSNSYYGLYYGYKNSASINSLTGEITGKVNRANEHNKIVVPGMLIAVMAPSSNIQIVNSADYQESNLGGFMYTIFPNPLYDVNKTIIVVSASIIIAKVGEQISEIHNVGCLKPYKYGIVLTPQINNYPHQIEISGGIQIIEFS